MKYTKTVWKDLPDTSTPITADKLNNIENGVEYLFENGVGGGSGSINVNNTKSTSTTDTYSCNYVNNAIKEVYSEEEQVIGTYDGKPLYRKILGKMGEVSLNDSVNFDVSDLNIDKIITYKGYVSTTDVSNTNMQYNISDVNLILFGPDVNIIMYDCVDINITSGQITIEYTKTTDK